MQDNEYTDTGACCQNCRWWSPYGAVCCNGDSKLCGGTTYAEFICDKWEGNDA